MSAKTLPKPLKYLGKSQGFPQRTFDEVRQTPFFPEVQDMGFWRSPENQRRIFEDLNEFVLTSPIQPDSELLKLAIHRTAELFRLATPVKPIHLNDVFSLDLDIWNKSPGLPWTTLGYKTKGDIKSDPEAIRRVRKFAHLIKSGQKMKFPDCMAFVRSHRCERGECKVRAVWGYPATVTFIEAMFAVPLIRAYQKMPINFRPMAYGFETATGGMVRLCKRFRRPDAHFVGIDFRKFDKTVPPWLINIAFDILLLNLNLTEYEEFGVADARRLLLLYTSIRYYFINTTILMADGRRYQKSSGIASGSYFTQLIGSVCNMILINWMSLEQFGHFPHDVLCLGDDSFLSTSRKWDIDWCSNFVTKIGMEINVAKCDQSESLTSIRFLGYSVGSGIPRKQYSEWMTALLYPERPDQEFADLQNRALGLYYANMCVDKEFARICKTIVTLRPFDIAFTSNFERMLKHIGVNIHSIDPYNLPNPLYFTRFM